LSKSFLTIVGAALAAIIAAKAAPTIAKNVKKLLATYYNELPVYLCIKTVHIINVYFALNAISTSNTEQTYYSILIKALMITPQPMPSDPPKAPKPLAKTLNTIRLKHYANPLYKLFAFFIETQRLITYAPPLRF
jgi:hypothetical protein